MLSVGFVGFGEVAATFSRPMVEHGARVSASDVLLAKEGGREVLQGRAQVEGILFRPLPELVRSADYVLSTVPTQAARQVARECAPYLRPGQVYVDLNSMAPPAKLEVAAIVRPSGAAFVEGAILGAIGASGAATRILLGGETAQEAAHVLAALGLNVVYYSPELGKASLFKMLRSVFSKGLEALLLELLIAGRRAGIERDLWDEVTGLMAHQPFDQTAANWIETHAVAYERRYHEVVQVAETLREMGPEPIMATATEAFFRRSLALGLADAFTARPGSVDAVVELMERRLRERAG